MRLLFVGETWKGSSARSLREGLSAISGLYMDEIGEDHYRPKGASLVIRAANRLLRPYYQTEIRREILRKISAFKPDVLLVYKGNLVGRETVKLAKAHGVLTVNAFPDYSPHAYGDQLKDAMGEYDLVVSTKPFHPANWCMLYGYGNQCEFVPHGYDEAVHYWPEAPGVQDLDVVMAASWRPQYDALMCEVARLMPESTISVALGGPGWLERRERFPAHWQYPGSLLGRAYCEFLRRGKVVIAPVHTDVIIGGRHQPGDEDTTRTYELAAAGVFFLHRRTNYVNQVYAEGREVVLWDDAAELVSAIRRYLPREAERRAMALAAHRRAVPAYSIHARAREVMNHIRAVVGEH